jgi:hypothetical protein
MLLDDGPRRMMNFAAAVADGALTVYRRSLACVA